MQPPPAAGPSRSRRPEPIRASAPPASLRGSAQALDAAPKRGLAQWMTWMVQRSGAASASVPASAPRVSASIPAKGGSSMTKPALPALT